MNRYLRVVALLVLSLSAVMAVAENPIVSQSVLVDKSGSMTISDVLEGPWTNGKAVLPFGRLHSVLWIRLRIHPPVDRRKIVLYILPSYINEVRLYEAGAGSPVFWKMRASGDLYPYTSRERQSPALGFVIDSNGMDQTYYLRIWNVGPMQVSALAFTPEQALEKDHWLDLLVLFFATSMMGVFLWAVHGYLLEKSRVMGLFALHQLVYILFGLSSCGYITPFLSYFHVDPRDRLTNLLYLAINFTIALFCRELFRSYRIPRRWMCGFTVILWCFPLFCAGYAVGIGDWVVHANVLLIRLTWIYMAATTFLLKGEGVPKKRFLQLLFVFLLLNNVIFWQVTHGNLPLAEDDLGLLQILILDGFVMAALFALVLHYRMQQKLLKIQQTTLRLQWLRKRFEREQALKNEILIQAHTDYLTKLSNRQHFLESVQSELQHAIHFGQPFSLLLIDIDHFKKINDTWGHLTGDAVLCEIATLLRNSLRAEDFLGRIGGEEFAAVMVEMEGTASIRAAQRLCAAVANASLAQAEGQQIHVSISIGLTQLRGRKIDLNTLIDEADKALYEAKTAGRNRVFVSAFLAIHEKQGSAAMDAKEWKDSRKIADSGQLHS